MKNLLSIGMLRVILVWFFILLSTQNDSAAETTLYYDPATGQYIQGVPETRSEESEYPLDVQVDNILLGQLDIVRKDGENWVDLKSLISLLNFPIDLTIDVSNDTNPQINASGWFIKPVYLFSIRHLENDVWEVTAKGVQFDLSDEDIWIKNNQLWVSESYALSWFNIKSDVNTLGLLMTLKPSEPLPVQLNARLKNRQLGAQAGSLAPEYVRRDIPYELLGPVFVDMQLSSSYNKLDESTARLSLLGAGDLAYMTGRYFIGTNYSSYTEPSQTTNFRLSLERKSLNDDLLGPLKATQVEIGDLIPTQIGNLQTSNELGVRISNQPYGHLTNSQTVNIVGELQPGWQVELYRNDIFLSSQEVADNGLYQFFDQNLTVGKNEFKLLFYGPQGQREERTETYNLDAASLVGGKWIYDLSVSQQSTLLENYLIESKRPRKEGPGRFSLHTEKGLGLNVSFTFDSSSYVFVDGAERTRHHFVQPGLRFFLFDTLFNAHWLKDVEGGYLGSFGVSRQFFEQQFSYQYRSGTRDFKRSTTETASTAESHSASMGGPVFRTVNTSLNYGLNYQRTNQFNQVQLESYLLSLGLKLWLVSLSNNLSYSVSQAPDLTSTASSGSFKASTYFWNTFWRTGIDYDIQPVQRIRTEYFSIQKYFGDSFSAEFTFNRDNLVNYDSGQLSLNWNNQHFLSSLQFGVDQKGFNSAYFSIRFGLGQNPIDNKLFITAQRASYNGAASALVFEDANNNNQYDLGEKPIKDAIFKSPQTRLEGKTDEQGVALISGLNPRMPTDLQLEASSLADPFWIPSQEGVSFLPRPGVVKTVLIPVVTSGEVDGAVYYVKDLSSLPTPLGQVPLVLTNIQTQKEYKRNSAYDGTFYIENVLPGRYKLNVDKNYLDKNNLKTKADLPVVIDGNGTLILGANFQLFPENLYSYSKEESSDTTGYALDLGSFSSEKNARIVLQALRNVFPSVLGEINSPRPYQLLLSQNADKTYQLILGPFYNLNRSKYLCANLVRSDLHCRILTNAIDFKDDNSGGLIAEPQNKTKLVSQQLKPLEVQDAFTIQLITTSSYETAMTFIDKYDLKDATVQQKEVNGKVVYSVVFGRYKTRPEAIAASSRLERLIGLKPWVRQFKF